MDKKVFFENFGGVYENSPWVAEAVWTISAGAMERLELVELFRQVVDNAKKEKKLILLRAHPDLAGKIAMAGKLSDASKAEQSGADLGNCTPEEFQTFRAFNEKYKIKFGFPFILAVRGYYRTQILAIFEERLKNTFDQEFKTALEQVHKIAYFRIQDLNLRGIN